MQIDQLIRFGIINIDKPSGPTSHQVAEYTRKILGIKKSGHSGTLDPAVTGCLPVALGNATRIMELLLKHGKEYVCVMEIHKDVDEDKVRKVLLSFKGKNVQLPPVKSAVKREERVREIYEIEILEIKDRLVLFRVSCEAGTYIRRLCDDAGKKLEVGAHMKELRRTRAGMFKEDTAVSLNDLRDAYELWKEGMNEHDGEKKKQAETLLRRYIQPIEVTIQDLRKVEVNEKGKILALRGQNLRSEDIIKAKGKKKERVAVLFDDKLIALGTLIQDSKDVNDKTKNKLSVNVSKVFVRPDV
jgi:H/ACA ribonucleoprotein complex subunit 4